MKTHWTLPAILALSAIPSSAQQPADPTLLLGEEVYGQSCATCHYNGSGNPAAPDLIGSNFWDNPPQKLAGIILRGQSRVSIVDGKLFNGIMPAMPSLTDEEIAAVASYVYTVFGKKPTKVEPSVVSAERAASEKAGAP